MHPQYTPAQVADFWTRIDRYDPSGCWPWRGYRNDAGYGVVYIDSVRNRSGIRAHRLAWELLYGPIPDGLKVCHHCDNPPCCRPDHLFVDTQAANMADAASKGRTLKGDRNPARLHPERMRRGEQQPQARLTDEQVRAIRQQYATEHPRQHVLAKQYGVTPSTISMIVTGVTWRHLLGS